MNVSLSATGTKKIVNFIQSQIDINLQARKKLLSC
jgi:hypothetical protein